MQLKIFLCQVIWDCILDNLHIVLWDSRCCLNPTEIIYMFKVRPMHATSRVSPYVQNQLYVFPFLISSFSTISLVLFKLPGGPHFKPSVRKQGLCLPCSAVNFVQLIMCPGPIDQRRGKISNDIYLPLCHSSCKWRGRFCSLQFWAPVGRPFCCCYPCCTTELLRDWDVCE